MPYKSAKQRKAMHAAASGRGRSGIKPSAARKFIAHSKSKPKRSTKRTSKRGGY